MLGDHKAWAPLIREGQPALTGVAYIGIRGMPPKGGAPGLSLEDFARTTPSTWPTLAGHAGRTRMPPSSAASKVSWRGSVPGSHAALRQDEPACRPCRGEG